MRRSNQQRSEDMQANLIAAARGVFVASGFAGAATPAIVAAAGVTRGALYHHFPDKRALFEAVVRAEARDVATAIDAATADISEPLEALRQGGQAFLAAMAAPGRARLLLVEAPAALGADAMAAIDHEYGGATLATGLAAAMAAGRMARGPVNELAALLSAAYDRAALAVAHGDDPAPWLTAIDRLLSGLAGQGASLPAEAMAPHTGMRKC